MRRTSFGAIALASLVLTTCALFLTACPTETAPSITSQPQSATVAPGGSVTFTISVTGTSPINFQWRKDGTELAGATSSSYQIAAVQASNQGSYTCLVSNSLGSVVSNAAVLTVGASLPIIDSQPESTVVGPGDYVSFSVSASGTGTLSYQWRKDGAAISGATADFYEIAAAAQADQGNYSCRVSNASGNRDSDAAQLVVSVEYGNGFDDGFAEDDWYWTGFDDSFATLGFSPVYYRGGTIPYVETPYYERGYDDGIWYAYNDGYFVAYDDAFTVGFSEGYDAAFFADYLNFLRTDQHVEYDNGGWGDGYNDGFSEGRIFGANDYEQGLDFNWLDALLDYRSGTDLNFAEIPLGTGEYGPVYLYVYGTDPTAAKADGAFGMIQKQRMAVRNGDGANAPEKASASLYRALTDDAKTKLNKNPSTTARSARELTLKTTWLQRVQAYQDAQNTGAKSLRLHAIQK